MAKKANVKITGRAIVYLQDVKKGNKLGKAKPVVITSVAVKKVAQKKTRKRRK